MYSRPQFSSFVWPVTIFQVFFLLSRLHLCFPKGCTDNVTNDSRLTSNSSVSSTSVWDGLTHVQSLHACMYCVMCKQPWWPSPGSQSSETDSLLDGAALQTRADQKWPTLQLFLSQQTTATLLPFTTEQNVCAKTDMSSQDQTDKPIKKSTYKIRNTSLLDLYIYVVYMYRTLSAV